MIIYQVQAKVKPTIVKEFIEWMASVHIREVVNTEHFLYADFCRLDPQPGNDELPFIIQYHCLNREALDNYFQNEASALRKTFNDKFGKDCVLSRVVMELIVEIYPHS